MSKISLAEDIISIFKYNDIKENILSSNYAGYVLKISFQCAKYLNLLLSELFEEYNSAKIIEDQNYAYYRKFGGYYPNSDYRFNILRIIREIKEIKEIIYNNINDIKSYKPWRYSISFKNMIEELNRRIYG